MPVGILGSGSTLFHYYAPLAAAVSNAGAIGVVTALTQPDAAALREERSSVDYDSADDEEAYLALEVARLHEEVPSLRFDTPPGELGLGEGWPGWVRVARLQGS